MTRDEFYDSLYLAHHGVKGQKWGVRKYQNEDGSYKPGAEHRYDPDGTPPRQSKASQTINSIKSKARNVDWKKVAKIGAGVAAGALVAYGAYKVAKDPQMISRGMDALRRQGHELKRINIRYKAGMDTINKMYKKDSGYDPLADKDQSIIKKAISDAKEKAVNAYDTKLGIKEANGGKGHEFSREFWEYSQAKYKHDIGEGPAPKELSAGAKAFAKVKEQRDAKAFLETIKKDPTWNDYLSKSQIDQLHKTAEGKYSEYDKVKDVVSKVAQAKSSAPVSSSSGSSIANKAKDAVSKVAQQKVSDVKSATSIVSNKAKNVVSSAKSAASTVSEKAKATSSNAKAGASSAVKKAKLSASETDYNVSLLKTLNAMRQMAQNQNGKQVNTKNEKTKKKK